MLRHALFSWTGKLMTLATTVAERLARGSAARERAIEMAWSSAVEQATWGVALDAAPREGAVLALCRRSTGASRTTLIVQHPLAPEDGDLSYHRGAVVTVTARYLNRAIDAVVEHGADVGLAVLHTHPGVGTPEWSDDDNRADTDLAAFLYGEGFLKVGAPLLSIVATKTALRARSLTWSERSGGLVAPVVRVRTVGLDRIVVRRTADSPLLREAVPAFADRSVRVLGRAGQKLLADLHIAVVGAGGVGSILAEHAARLGFGAVTVWDPDVVKDVNINRSAIFNFWHALFGLGKAMVVARALRRFALVRDVRVRWRRVDVRKSSELAIILDADVILIAADDARARHLVNMLAFAHCIPALDAGSVIATSGDNNGSTEVATVEGAGMRVSILAADGPCLWCAGHLTSKKLGSAYRSPSDVAADRARGYVENLGPEEAPSVMPVNAMTAALVEIRLLDMIFGLSGRRVAEVYYDMLANTLDELPRSRNSKCRNCARVQGAGDAAELPHSDE